MICDKCGKDKPDALRRLARNGEKDHFGGDPQLLLDPVLCCACCAQYPDREWMRASPWHTWTPAPEGAQA